MTHSTIYVHHQIAFLCLVALACGLPWPDVTSSNLQVYVTLLLFFGLGIPHGALDLSLAKKLLEPKFKGRWGVLFAAGYLLCIGGLVACWMQLPLPSFVFFLAISVFHFGFSDRLNRQGWISILEGFARGLLPIVLPAYFYPELFHELVKSSLSNGQALILSQIVRFFFYPDLILLGVLIFEGFMRIDRSALLNSLELVSLLVLFLSLKPFAAFLIYFCFLHSCRHILNVLEEMKRPINGDSGRWVFWQALPATLITLGVLIGCYIIFQHQVIDVRLMLKLFFISLSALTLPHMILVEAVSRCDLSFNHPKR